MTSYRGPSRLAYDDLAAPGEMVADCRAVGDALGLADAATRATGPTPSLRYDDYPREVAKREITVSAAAQRLAAALQLHLD